MFKYMYSSFAISIFCLSASFFIGYNISIEMAMSMLFSTLVIGIMETTFSVDNAVVNSRILREMSDFWQKMFVTIGIAVAVFGMRFLIPIVIVQLASEKTFFEAFQIATHNPELYESTLLSCHYLIMGFGFSFLGLVALDFFMNDNENHLLPLEGYFAKVPDLLKPFVKFAFLAGVTLLTLPHLPYDNWMPFIVSVAVGFGLKFMLDMFEVYFGEDFAMVVAKRGLIGFLYLEVLDASFSFDGLTSAFAVTKDFWCITLGCGIGSAFVRSLTLYMVDHATLTKFKYLEPAAFYSIAFLVLTMILSANHFELSEAVVGITSATLIGIGVVASIISNKKNPVTISA